MQRCRWDIPSVARLAPARHAINGQLDIPREQCAPLRSVAVFRDFEVLVDGKEHHEATIRANDVCCNGVLGKWCVDPGQARHESGKIHFHPPSAGTNGRFALRLAAANPLGPFCFPQAGPDRKVHAASPPMLSAFRRSDVRRDHRDSMYSARC